MIAKTFAPFSGVKPFVIMRAQTFQLSAFWAIRLTYGGDGEMRYPGGSTRWAFGHASRTGQGLPNNLNLRLLSALSAGA